MESRLDKTRNIEKIDYNPKYPHMKNYIDRIHSFRRNISIYNQSIYEMAKSGFFYGNVGDDTVICYQCGIRLSNWDVSDIPDVEHRRWCPDCALVKLRRYNSKVNRIIDMLLQLKL